MTLRKRRARRLVAVRGRQAASSSEWEDEYWPEIHMVGAAVSDWGPSDEPRSWPWRKRKNTEKPPFGFARALED